jgi:phage gp16-like protein
MTLQENRQRIKSEALNKIRKLYHPNAKHGFTYYPGEGSKMEQIAYETERIITEMERELADLKEKQ